MGKLKRSFEIAKASWKILRKDKFLILFPIVSTVVGILIIASFLVPLGFYLYHGFLVNQEQARLNSLLGIFNGPLSYLWVFIIYLMSYFIMFFFNSALVHCVLNHLEGKPAGFWIGIKGARSRIGALFIWALVSATVGVILNIIENYTKGLIGKIITRIFGATWTIATYFMVPVLVFEETNVKKALKRSLSIFRNVWGEQIIGMIGLGGFFSLLFIVILFICLFIGALIGYLFGSTVGLFIGGGAGVGLAILCAPFIILFQSTMNEIYRAVIYSYGVTGTLPAEFPQNILPLFNQPQNKI
ncbi:MAG: DUF6159 family protein [Planctomycetota bacterium]